MVGGRGFGSLGKGGVVSLCFWGGGIGGRREFVVGI